MKRIIFPLFLMLVSCSEGPRPLPLKSKVQPEAADGEKNAEPKPTKTTSESTLPETEPVTDTTGGATVPVPDKPAIPVETPKEEISLTTGIAKVAVVPSPGCNKAPSQEFGKYVKKNVTGMNRVYQLRLPANYDKAKPYRLLMIGHGCGGTDAPFKLESVAKDQAIIVAMKSLESCFVYEMKAEGPYFDEVLKEVSNEACVDTNRVFVAGFSSGSWLTNMLGCARSNVIRAQGNASGSLPGGLPTCQGPIPAFMVHDDKDTVNTIDGGQRARDRILKINSCSTETEPYSYDDNPKTPSICVKYKGCKPGFPVVWCTTSGNGHTSEEPISTLGFWKFWSGF
ncbi:MAG: hypothetical protein EOP07_19400 [Proteobacteria bacterium]|nr:MAG: hypothetical protein EOP07_19400 [Pseudomonadota bacterium]